MSKRKTTKTAAKSAIPDDSGTASYATRLTPEQRAVIDRAAGEVGWSPAKFIREAAVSRAVDVVNASGASRPALRILAATALQQMMGLMLDAQRVAELKRQGALEMIEDHEPMRPATSAELHQIKEAMATSGTEFLRMMLEQWDSVMSGATSYAPKVSAANLLKGGDE